MFLRRQQQLQRRMPLCFFTSSSSWSSPQLLSRTLVAGVPPLSPTVSNTQKRLAAHNFSPETFNTTSDQPFMQNTNDSGDANESRKLAKLFFDESSRRCKLCLEPVPTTYNLHSAHPLHQARVGIVERLLSGSAGDPALFAERAWKAIDLAQTDTNEVDFGRIKSLSSTSIAGKLRRMNYLLRFLVDKGIIRHSLVLLRKIDGYVQMVKTSRFETFEMVGDNVVKCLVQDRLDRIFPQSQGGCNSKLSLMQQMIDSNEGLIRVHDYFRLEELVGIKMTNNKAKADVVESVFGELGCFLYATEEDFGSFRSVPFLQPEVRYLRAVVSHVLNEFSHTIIAWCISSTTNNAMEIIREKYNPHAARANQRMGSGGMSSSLGHERSNEDEELLDFDDGFTLPVAHAVQRPLITARARPRALSQAVTLGVGVRGNTLRPTSWNPPAPHPQMFAVSSADAYNEQLSAMESQWRAVEADVLVAEQNARAGDDSVDDSGGASSSRRLRQQKKRKGRLLQVDLHAAMVANKQRFLSRGPSALPEGTATSSPSSFAAAGDSVGVSYVSKAQISRHFAERLRDLGASPTYAPLPLAPMGLRSSSRRLGVVDEEIRSSATKNTAASVVGCSAAAALLPPRSVVSYEEFTGDRFAISPPFPLLTRGQWLAPVTRINSSRKSTHDDDDDSSCCLLLVGSGAQKMKLPLFSAKAGEGYAAEAVEEAARMMSGMPHGPLTAVPHTPSPDDIEWPLSHLRHAAADCDIAGAVRSVVQATPQSSCSSPGVVDASDVATSAPSSASASSAVLADDGSDGLLSAVPRRRPVVVSGGDGRGGTVPDVLIEDVDALDNMTCLY